MGGDAVALVGSAGFVGTALRAARPFAAHFDGQVEALGERAWDEVVCAAPWTAPERAAADPDGDRAALERLWDALRRTAARRVVLISTVDVYEEPRGRDERDAPDATRPFGRHRAELEQRVLDGFSDAAVVRLPAVYGPGLDGGPLLELLQGAASPLPRTARLQLYDVERLAGDLDAIAERSLKVVQLVTEPVPLGDVVDRCFPEAAPPAVDGPAPHYDLRTRHARAFGGRDGYLEDAAAVLDGVERFVARVRDGEVAISPR